MGNLVLEQFQTELLFDLRNRTDTTAPEGVTEDRLNIWIQAAYDHITHPSVFRHKELQFRWSIPLVSGTSGYVFTPTSGAQNITALKSVAHVFGTTDTPTTFRVKLLAKDSQWVERRTIVVGPPREYYTEGNLIYVSPVPGANEATHILALRGWREASPLVTGQPTELRPIWDEVLLLAARWRAELHLGYRDLAEGTKADFVGMLNEYQTWENLQGEDWDFDSGLAIKGYMAGSTR